MNQVLELAERLRGARHAVVLTGAGASTDSGLPDFRSKQGLWQGLDPTKLISMTALRRSPVEFYQFYRQRFSRLRGAKPNPVHTALAALQKAGYVKTLLTQNVDSLHQAAGSPDVVELHGNLRECACTRCGRRFGSALIDVDVTSPDDVPACPQCGGLLKPAVVLFDEALPDLAIDLALESTQAADLFLVVGSSLEVSPVNQLPLMALGAGADLAILTLEPTYLDGQARWVFRDRAAGVLSAIADELLGAGNW